MNAVKSKLSSVDALVICRYISIYALFEKSVKRIFFDSIASVDNISKNKLYFYYGGTVGTKVYIDYDSCQIKMDSKCFKEEELFKELSLNQIIKIDKKEHIVNQFKFNINSESIKNLEYTFHDCCLKLISMRNKLAHELESLSFKNGDYIEILTNQYLKDFKVNWITDVDPESMEDTTKSIYCNIIFMEKMNAILSERSNRNENTRMDS